MGAFADIVGHAAVLTRLSAALAADNLPHAVLLAGPDAVGKTTIGRALASAALDSAAWPGGAEGHPDFWLEDGDSERIGIDRIRSGARGSLGPSLQDFFGLRAYAGGGRVAVIGRADRLTEQAANCLLKTLEEPPPGGHIVLCAANPERLPATILSRCQSLAVGGVSANDISRWLQAAHGVDVLAAATAAALAQGRPGRALRLARDTDALRLELDALDAFLAAAGGGVAGALQAAGSLVPATGADGRDRAVLQLGVWTGFLRDVACYIAGVPELAQWTGYRAALERWAENLTADRVLSMIEACLRATEELAAYSQPRLTYDVLFLDIFGASSTPPRVEPIARSVSLGGAGRPPHSRSSEPARRPTSGVR